MAISQSTKRWRDALSRAVHRESDGKGSASWLEVIADRCVRAAADGDMQAIKEIGDRLDGKPRQEVEHAGEVGVFSAAPVSAEEWQRRHADCEAEGD